MPEVVPTQYVTVAEFKQRIASNTDRDDQIIAKAIQYASAQIEDWCGRTFLLEPVEARSFRVNNRLIVRIDDCVDVDIVEVSINGKDGDYQVITDFVPEARKGEPYSRIEADMTIFPSGRGCWMRVTPTSTAGWGWRYVPDQVHGATMLQASKLFKRKDTADAMMALEGGMAARRLDTGKDRDAIALLSGLRRGEVFSP